MTIEVNPELSRPVQSSVKIQLNLSFDVHKNDPANEEISEITREAAKKLYEGLGREAEFPVEKEDWRKKSPTKETKDNAELSAKESGEKKEKALELIEEFEENTRSSSTDTDDESESSNSNCSESCELKIDLPEQNVDLTDDDEGLGTDSQQSTSTRGESDSVRRQKKQEMMEKVMAAIRRHSPHIAIPPGPYSKPTTEFSDDLSKDEMSEKECDDLRPVEERQISSKSQEMLERKMKRITAKVASMRNSIYPRSGKRLLKIKSETEFERRLAELEEIRKAIDETEKEIDGFIADHSKNKTDVVVDKLIKKFQSLESGPLSKFEKRIIQEIPGNSVVQMLIEKSIQAINEPSGRVYESDPKPCNEEDIFLREVKEKKLKSAKSLINWELAFLFSASTIATIFCVLQYLQKI